MNPPVHLHDRYLDWAASNVENTSAHTIWPAAKESIMLRNMGNTERFIRVLIGLAICGVGLHYRNWWGLIGVAVIIGAAVAICPMYHMLGIRKSQCCQPGSDAPNSDKPK